MVSVVAIVTREFTLIFIFRITFSLAVKHHLKRHDRSVRPLGSICNVHKIWDGTLLYVNSKKVQYFLGHVC